MADSKVLIEPFHLTQSDPNITSANGTANLWSDIWTYQVPQGTAHQLLPTDTISLYLRDSSPAEVGSQTCRVAIEVRDPAEQDKYRIYGEAVYLRSKEFQERPKMARLNCPPTVVEERYWIVIMAKDDGTIYYSTSYFDLLTSRVRRSLG